MKAWNMGKTAKEAWIFAGPPRTNLGRRSCSHKGWCPGIGRALGAKFVRREPHPSTLDEHGFEPRRTVAHARRAALARALIEPRHKPGPREQMTGRREWAHIRS